VAVDIDLFSDRNFQSTIRGYCNQLGWMISDLNSRRAILKFTANSGTTQTVFIIRHDDTLEFSCPSGLKFQSAQQVSGALSTYLLQENCKYKVGFWCIEEIDEKLVFSIMHNAEMTLLNSSHFRQIVLKLVNACDDFEQLTRKILMN
jgi:hypothetical protein